MNNSKKFNNTISEIAKELNGKIVKGKSADGIVWKHEDKIITLSGSFDFYYSEHESNSGSYFIEYYFKIIDKDLNIRIFSLDDVFSKFFSFFDKSKYKTKDKYIDKHFHIESNSQTFLVNYISIDFCNALKNLHKLFPIDSIIMDIYFNYFRIRVGNWHTDKDKIKKFIKNCDDIYEIIKDL